MNDLRYAHAFGVLESAVHRALRELEHSQFSYRFKATEAEHILRTALQDLEFNHGIELHWPDDVKENDNAR